MHCNLNKGRGLASTGTTTYLNFAFCNCMNLSLRFISPTLFKYRWLGGGRIRRRVGFNEVSFLTKGTNFFSRQVLLLKPLRAIIFVFYWKRYGKRWLFKSDVLPLKSWSTIQQWNFLPWKPRSMPSLLTMQGTAILVCPSPSTR